MSILSWIIIIAACIFGTIHEARKEWQTTKSKYSLNGKRPLTAREHLVEVASPYVNEFTATFIGNGLYCSGANAREFMQKLQAKRALPWRQDFWPLIQSKFVYNFTKIYVGHTLTWPEPDTYPTISDRDIDEMRFALNMLANSFLQASESVNGWMAKGKPIIHDANLPPKNITNPTRRKIIKTDGDGTFLCSAEEMRMQARNAIREHKSELFEERFLQKKPHLLKKRNKPSYQAWAIAYFDEFEDNLEYLDYFAEMVKRRKGFEINAEKARSAVYDVIIKRSNERRMDAVRRKIAEDGVTPTTITIEDIDNMDGFEFERFLERLFDSIGFIAKVTKGSGDQGADLIIEKLGERTVVQAKRYSSPVSNRAIQEVVAAKAYYDCEKAMVVTNSRFTSSAKSLAFSNSVTLWDRDKLKELIQEGAFAVAE